VKQGRLSAALGGLEKLAEALTALRKGRVDVGFFAGHAGRSDEAPGKADARTKRAAQAMGAGAKPGYYKPGVALSQKRARIRALLASGAEGQTNPELAAKHEFGIGVPRRSMLRMPFHLHGDGVVAKAKKEVRARLATLAAHPKKGAQQLLQRVAIAAEGVVDDAFATRGYGSWKPNAPLTVELKGSDAPLIDTGQLRRAVDSRVVGV
jgi:hypothetical protein